MTPNPRIDKSLTATFYGMPTVKQISDLLYGLKEESLVQITVFTGDQREGTSVTFKVALP